MYWFFKRFENRKSSRRKSRHTRSRLGEQLEPRQMLTASPTVADVNLSSTDWSTDFIDFLEDEGLGTNGYSIPDGGNQLDTLPWTNLNQVSITFSEDVNVSQDHLAVRGSDNEAYDISSFSYSSSTSTAVWTLASHIAADELMLDLDGNGLNPITDLSGNILDGDWNTGSSAYPSGDGTAGGDFEFRFNVLPGDTTGNPIVSNLDVIFTIAVTGSDTDDADFWYQKDVDGDGEVDVADVNDVYAHLGDTLPNGNEPTGNDAPELDGNPTVAHGYGLITVTGSFADDGDLDDVTVYFDVGGTTHTVGGAADGTFTFDVGSSNGGGSIDVWFVDDEGAESDHTTIYL